MNLSLPERGGAKKSKASELLTGHRSGLLDRIELNYLFNDNLKHAQASCLNSPSSIAGAIFLSSVISLLKGNGRRD